MYMICLHAHDIVRTLPSLMFIEYLHLPQLFLQLLAGSLIAGCVVGGLMVVLDLTQSGFWKRMLY